MMPKTTNTPTPEPTLNDLIATHGGQLVDLLYTLGVAGHDVDRAMAILTAAATAASEICPADAVRQWSVVRKGKWTHGKWTTWDHSGYKYPSLDQAKESADRDMRDAGPEREDNEGTRYRIIPLRIIVGKPIPVRYRDPDPGPYPPNHDD